MNILNEIWKIASAAWIDIARTFTCFFLKARLQIVNQQIDGAKRYIESVNDKSSNLTRSFADYFKSKLPEWTGERESLEAQIEINGCAEE